MKSKFKAFSSIGKTIIEDGWGMRFENDLSSLIRDMPYDQKQLCLIARMADELNECRNQLHSLEDKLPAKVEGYSDPVADAYLQCLNLKAGDKLIVHMNLGELPTRPRSLIELDMRYSGLSRRSQITEENLKGSGWGPKYRKQALDWAQKDKEKDQQHAG